MTKRSDHEPRTIIPSDEDIEAFQRDGAVLIKNLLPPSEVESLRKGVAFNRQNPGPYASCNEKSGETGLFFDDYCNWTRIPEFRNVIEHGCMARVAAKLMRSSTAQFFHDHVLVKEPQTTMATPWHTDGPYYFVEGSKTLSFWIPLDKISAATCLRCVTGSHRSTKPFLPTRWVSEEPFFPDLENYIDIPDPDKESMHIMEWDLEPGDAIAFSFDTLHGSRGNPTDKPRRVVTFRFLGDNIKYIERPGPTSPPFPNHGMTAGQQLRNDWFPILYSE